MPLITPVPALGLFAQGFARSLVKESREACDFLCLTVQIIGFKRYFCALSGVPLIGVAAWRDAGDRLPRVPAARPIAANDNHGNGMPPDATSNGKGVGLQ